jgi:hypothetical protein
MNTSMMLGIGGAIVAIGAITVAVYKYTESLNAERAALVRLNEAELNNIKNRNTLKGIIEETAVMQNQALATSLNQELAANDLSLKAELKKNNEKFAALQNTGVNMGNLLFQQASQEQAIEEKFQKQAQEIRDKYSKQELKQAQETALKKRQYQASNVMQSITGRIEFAGFGNAPIEPKLPNLTPPNYVAEQYNKLSQDMLNAKILLIKTNEQIWASLKESTSAGIANAFTGIGTAIGDSLAASLSGEDADMMDAIGVAIVKSLGQMAVQVGSMLIAMSVPMMLAGVPQGFVYAAAGTGLIAVGATVSGLAGRKSKGGSSQPNTPSIAESTLSKNASGSYYNGASSDNGLRVTGKIAGRDIVISNNQTLRAQGRSTNIG